MIARTDDALYYTTVAGKIIDYSMDMTKQVVNTKSDLSIRFSPLHSLRKGDTILNIDVDYNLGVKCPGPSDADAYKLNSPMFVKKFEASSCRTPEECKAEATRTSC